VIDHETVPFPPHLWPHVPRLALLGGIFLVLVVVIAPIANELLTRRAGQVIPMSGYNVLLTVTMILIVVRAIEGHRGVAPFTASPSGVP
jgi:preprotein translocase subunit SecY